MLKYSIWKAAASFALAILALQAVTSSASAQTRTLTITPRAAGSSGPYTFTDSAGSWDRVSGAELGARGPHYPAPAGVRIVRGRLVPNTVDTALMRNVSIRGLRRGIYYGYFSTDDNRTVIVNPSTRRVARIMLFRGDGALPASVAATPASTTVTTQTAALGAYPADYAYDYGYTGLGLGAGYYGGGYYDGGYYGGGYWGGGYYPGIGRPGIGRPGVGRPGVGLGPRPTPYGGRGGVRVAGGGGRVGVGGGGGRGRGRR